MKYYTTWSSEEDVQLLRIMTNPPLRNDSKVNWNTVSSMMISSIRSAKQCRERYVNILNPKLNRQPWTYEEDVLFAHLCMTFGKAWTKLSKRLGRSPNDLKNRYHTKNMKKYVPDAIMHHVLTLNDVDIFKEFALQNVKILRSKILDQKWFQKKSSF
jgi:myb proto-oncogene protein